VPFGYPYLGRAGALVQLPSPMPGYEATPLIRGGTHELAAGGNVRDRSGVSRRWVLSWPALNADSWTLVHKPLWVPGPYRYLDVWEPNLLTANQSTGTDHLRDTTGFRAVTQGAVASSAAWAHGDLRSLEWDTDTALTVASGRGVAFSTSLTSVDKSWAAVRPSVAYSFSVWAHASVAVSMAARIDWYTAAGALISSDAGTGTAVSTSGWTQLTCANKTSPSTAAYGICGVHNTTTTGAALIAYFDDAQLEEGAAATSWRVGVGTPLVSVDALSPSVLLGDAALGTVLREAELVLLEVG
jgi:hypothetical protein